MPRCRKVFPGLPQSYERAIEVNGLTGRYTDVGRGPVVVIFASTLVLARSYVWTIDCLAPHFRVITVEMPGCGHASRPPRMWGFVDYAGWMAGFVRAMRLHRPTIVGHSNSGGSAMVAAAMYPDAVGRLVLADTVGGLLSPSLPAVLVGRAVDAFLEPRLTVFGWHHVIYNALFFTKDFFGQVWKSVYEDLRPYAGKVRAPTLFAWGAHDHTIPLSAAHALKALMPNATMYVSREGSHDWLIDRADEFAGVMREFVTDAQT